MGEKGNVFDNAQDVFANLAEQGPQFWLDYKRYKQERPSLTETGAAAEEEAGEGAPASPPALPADAPADRQPAPPAAE